MHKSLIILFAIFVFTAAFAQEEEVLPMPSRTLREMTGEPKKRVLSFLKEVGKKNFKVAYKFVNHGKLYYRSGPMNNGILCKAPSGHTY